MFDSEFAKQLLERISGNSATIVLRDSGECAFVSSNAASILGMGELQLLEKDFLSNLQFYNIENIPVAPDSTPIAQALANKDFVQSTPFFCKLAVDRDQTFVLNTMHVANSLNTQFVVVQIRQAKREVNVGEMKSLFVSFAAHQLKTPSSVVKGFLELMMRNGESAYSNEQWHFLTSAFESNEQLIDVSKSLLNMARLEGGLIAPQIHEFNPVQLLDYKRASFVSLYKTKQLSISIANTENEDTIFSDESFFLEVFGILLGNAIKHTPNGGKIHITCDVRASQCEVHVIDNGPGIAAGVRKTLFTSEQDSSDKDNSHGLGLYMAKKYIALLGGSIGLSDSKQGSDFYFIVPNAKN